MRVHQSFLDDCLYRMQLKLETNQFFGGSVRALGSGYHKSIENYYVARQHGGAVEPVAAEIDRLVLNAQDDFDRLTTGGTSHSSETDREFGGFKWNKAIPDRDTAMEKLDVMVRSYFEGGNYYPADWQVLAVEQFFDLPWFGEHTRGGSIDLILLDPNNWVVIDDQKTAGRAWPRGKESPRKNIQAPWYSWAVQELFPGYSGYRSVFSIMQYNGKFERRLSDPKPEHVAGAVNALSSAVGVYEVSRANGLDLPANPSSNLCSPEFCDYFSTCPHGSALE
jgi:hypothetical protein